MTTRSHEAVKWRASFHQQARVDYQLFLHLSKRQAPERPAACHLGLLLQMATEKLAKAAAFEHRPPDSLEELLSHAFFAGWVRNRLAARPRPSPSALALAHEIERLNPSVAGTPFLSVNVEYPWHDKESGRIHVPVRWSKFKVVEEFIDPTRATAKRAAGALLLRDLIEGALR